MRFLQRGSLFFGAVCLVLLVGSCVAPTAAPANTCADPSMSVFSVFGNTQYMSTAKAFFDNNLYSAATVGFSGELGHWDSNSSAAYANTAEYYYDPDLYTGLVQDNDPDQGVDQSMLLFYAGHGNSDGFDALGDFVTPSNMSLGNCSQNGLTRYLWLGSCQVFAHGPNMGGKVCGSSGIVADPCYDTPGGWNPSDPTEMNVFDRWGPVLDPSLRMACGASMDVVVDPQFTQSIWKNYAQQTYKYDVADSFINAMWKKGSIGLCITKGTSDMAATPLVTDKQFTTLANTAGATHYHMLYAQAFTPPYDSVAPALPPPSIPPSLPSFSMITDSAPIDPTGVVEEELQLDIEELSEDEYISRAAEFLSQNELLEPYMATPTGVHLRLAMTPVEMGEGNSIEIAQKNVVVSFKRQLNLRDLVNESGNNLPEIPDLVDVIGSGGALEVRLNNNGDVSGVSKTWRQVIDISDIRETKPYEDAYSEAFEQLGEAGKGLSVGRWTWGYLEDTDGVSQQEFLPFYEFWFVPNQDYSSFEFPPQVIYVSAFR